MDSLDVTLFTGWDVGGGAEGEASAVGASTAGAVARSGLPDVDREASYELLAVASRGVRPPRFLTAADLPDERAGPDHDPAGDVEPAVPALEQTWSLLYRRLTETGPPDVAASAIYLLGVNPPPGATDDELEIFNDFYTNVHLPEVAARRHALRAARYELVREVRAPHRGAPRYLAIYEVDQAGASARRHVGPPYARGPEVWQRHKTPWRFWYRRLGINKHDAPDV